VALVTTILTVLAMLGGITFLLWISTMIEARQLGPAGSTPRSVWQADPNGGPSS
jgi:hypothetical protein